MNLARYESHKIVVAGKFKYIDSRMDSGCTIVVEQADGTSYTHTPSNDFWNRVGAGEKLPKVDDYFVIYAPDNYESWSPRAQFENGYTRIAS